MLSKLRYILLFFLYSCIGCDFKIPEAKVFKLCTNPSSVLLTRNSNTDQLVIGLSGEKSSITYVEYTIFLNGEELYRYTTQGSPNLNIDMKGRFGVYEVVAKYGNNCGELREIAVASNIPFYLPIVRVDGGTFKMGSDIFEGPFGNETPAHNVTLTSFQIGKYEVTQFLWKEIMGSYSGSIESCDLCPVESVSWIESNLFISTLNQRYNETYRLPTEAEWEYAARGGEFFGDNFRYAGSDNSQQVSWYNVNSNRPQEVGLKMPNQLGIFDMSGNVWEWTNDNYGNYPNYDTFNPVGNLSGNSKVARGGGYSSDELNCRVAGRSHTIQPYEASDLGFRIAKDL